MTKVSDKPLTDVYGEDYGSIPKFCAACLIDLNEVGEDKIFTKCHLPVFTPDGAILRKGVYFAAQSLAGSARAVKAPAQDKARAARKLLRLYSEIGEEPPESIKRLAGE